MARSSRAFGLISRVMVVGGMVMAGASSAFALPVGLTRAEFAAQTAGLPTIVEDFEGFALGDHASPLVLANGTYTAATTAHVNWALCGHPNMTQCVSSQDVDPRSFSLFPAGTTFWAADYNFALGYGSEFYVTVVGGSGTVVFTQIKDFDRFVGFTDPLGLVSITISQPLGDQLGNWSFDNVTTAGPAAVPEPTTLVLLATGLAGLHWRRRTSAR